MWTFPLIQCSGIPINHHPGAFGFRRSANYHTGVDLYTSDGADVFAVEDGVVVNVAPFTGPKMGHNWWEETMGVMVEGASGVVSYGEITPDTSIKIGSSVIRNSLIGKVKRVLFENRHRTDIPGHSTSMLHLELYEHGVRDFIDWFEPQRDSTLLDPTPHLIFALNSPNKFLTWYNSENRSVG